MSFWNVLLIVLAVIGVIALVGIAGMSMMHVETMGGMAIPLVLAPCEMMNVLPG
jgi:hypothetical protein